MPHVGSRRHSPPPKVPLLLQYAKQKRFEKINHLLEEELESLRKKKNSKSSSASTSLLSCSLVDGGHNESFTTTKTTPTSRSTSTSSPSSSPALALHHNNNNSSSSSSGRTLLHGLMMYQPPLETVELVMKRITTLMKSNSNNHFFVPEEALDAQGRTPLHTACIYHADVQVVKRLLQGTTLIVPALTKDQDGRFPLHWACCGSSSMDGDNTSNTDMDGARCTPFCFQHGRRRRRLQKKHQEQTVTNTAAVVATLIKAYPQAVCIPDKRGYTPLDLAVENNLPDMIVHMLEMRSPEKAAAAGTARGSTMKQPLQRQTPSVTDESTTDEFLWELGVGNHHRNSNSKSSHRTSNNARFTGRYLELDPNHAEYLDDMSSFCDMSTTMTPSPQQRSETASTEPRQPISPPKLTPVVKGKSLMAFSFPEEDEQEDESQSLSYLSARISLRSIDA